LNKMQEKRPQNLRFEVFSLTWFPCCLVEISGIEPLTSYNIVT